MKNDEKTTQKLFHYLESKKIEKTLEKHVKDENLFEMLF